MWVRERPRRLAVLRHGQPDQRNCPGNGDCLSMLQTCSLWRWTAYFSRTQHFWPLETFQFKNPVVSVERESTAIAEWVLLCDAMDSLQPINSKTPWGGPLQQEGLFSCIPWRNWGKRCCPLEARPSTPKEQFELASFGLNSATKTLDSVQLLWSSGPQGVATGSAPAALQRLWLYFKLYKLCLHSFWWFAQY